MDNLAKISVGIIGLGYVGLPLLIAMSKHYQTIGFDVDQARVDALNNGYDATGEAELEGCFDTSCLSVTSELSLLSHCNYYIITVPTPIDEDRRPDLSMVVDACRSISKILSDGDVDLGIDSLSWSDRRSLRAIAGEIQV